VQELCQQEICPRKCGIPIVDELRDKIVQKAGLYGFRSLDIIFKKFDLNNDKTLSKKELDAGMRELGIEPTQFELDTIMRHFDSNDDGRVSRREFVEGLSTKMGEDRRSLIFDLYNLVFQACDGEMTVPKMVALCDMAQHPLVCSGRQQEAGARIALARAWDLPDDHVIDKHEFVQFWADVSAAVADDDYFELMIRNPWHLAGGKGVSQNTSCRRVVVVHTDGRQTTEVVKNDLGIGPHDQDTMLRLLQIQGVIDARAVQPIA